MNDRAPDVSGTDARASEFLAIADQFQLGDLVTESSHPVTAELSTAAADTAEGLRLLFEVDRDVLAKFREVAETDRMIALARRIRHAVDGGHKIFFTGCGSTGRLSILLDSMWRRACQQAAAEGDTWAASAEDRTFSVMAGGDFALIKSVEGFEDFTQFGRKQIADLGVGPGDVVFAITEGGETSFVIGTAWEGLEKGADVVFVYNNPDDVLVRTVERSREVIEEPRIQKVNLTTGPMAITGSTRMQATTIQLLVLGTALEMAWTGRFDRTSIDRTVAGIEQAHAALLAPEFRRSLAALVDLEASVYRSGNRNNYFAHEWAVDLLTDTTERSPTYCTPPFRRFDDRSATESWAFLYVPEADTPSAWRNLLHRCPRCVEWSREEIAPIIEPEKLDRTMEVMARIGRADLMKFRIGRDGLGDRVIGKGGLSVALVGPSEHAELTASGSFFGEQLRTARDRGARIALVLVGEHSDVAASEAWTASNLPEAVVVPLVLPGGFVLDTVRRAAVKMLLNALSTCTMVKLGRVIGNTMVWVVPSNLKLIDRSTRYICRLTGLEYEPACRLLFEIIDYVSPRMQSDQAYPPVVGLAVTRVRENLGNEDAEKLFWSRTGI
ncbi:MAG: hypothetical protein SNJ74_05050 [Fimbriimonadaceae bacterium]